MKKILLYLSSNRNNNMRKTIKVKVKIEKIYKKIM